MVLDAFSKENRWYCRDIDGHIKLESRKLLEEYSHIVPGDVDTHVYKLVRISILLSTPSNQLTANSAIPSGPTALTPASGISNF